MPLWIDILSRLTPAFITLLVGGLGSYIAFNQYRVNKEKLKLDLFDKRFEAYEKVQAYFAYLVRKARVDDEALATLYEARYKSQFLFDEEILEHISEVWDKAIQMRKIHLQLYGENRLPVGEERTKLAREYTDLLSWNSVQQNQSPKRYSKYLRLRL